MLIKCLKRTELKVCGEEGGGCLTGACEEVAEGATPALLVVCRQTGLHPRGGHHTVGCRVGTSPWYTNGGSAADPPDPLKQSRDMDSIM